WLAGFAVGLAGWALYVAALRLAPLSLVQAIAAGGVGLLALLVERTAGAPLARRERAGASLAVLGLVALALSLAGHAPAGRHGSAAAVALWLAGSAAAAAVFSGASPRLPGGVGLGVAAGVLYAAGDVATKAAVAGGAAVLLAAAVLASHGLAFAALQLGFQRGGALATAGVASLLTNALPIPAGARGAARILAFALVLAGALLLARATDAGAEAAGRPAGRSRRARARPA